MHSTRQIYTFVLMMTTVVALVLAGLFTLLKGIHQKNEAVFTKRAILASVMPKEVKGMSDDDVISLFQSKVKQTVVDVNGNVISQDEVKKRRSIGAKPGLAEDLDLAKEKKQSDENRLFPLFEYETSEGKVFITAVRGSGLWDEIWGYVALKSDLNTVVGVSFDHKAETPGLGAEIKDNPAFPAQFKGKTIYNDGEYTSIYVRKGGAKNTKYEVDGISGATITGDGVAAMMYDGLKYYEPVFQKIKEGKLK